MHTSEECEYEYPESRDNAFPFHSMHRNPNNYYNNKYKCKDFHKDVSLSFLLLLGLGIFQSPDRRRTVDNLFLKENYF